MVTLSAALYAAHYRIFHDAHHIFIYLLGDVAFVPVEVLLVTLVIHSLLKAREKHSLRNKLNMVIGAFFSEVGTELLTSFSRWNPATRDLGGRLVTERVWTRGGLAKLRKIFRAHACELECRPDDLAPLREFLSERRDFLLGLLGNPNLLEHESFTELLWAVFHLTEELAARKDLSSLPDSDLKHLRGDISRSCKRLVSEWLGYMKHLRRNYPYLFSLAVRMNPFDPEASAVVES